ncbi:hypothetical protein HMPREF2815_00095 [Bacteroides sp. HMSC068A09]|nr:hypothetical protein HMPREF2815_00095 [Bacteroides sp. HMSC068A09]
MVGDKFLITVRADDTINTYECMIRGGFPVAQILELANAVLYQDMRFSKPDTVFEVVSEWLPKVELRQRTFFCLKV